MMIRTDGMFKDGTFKDVTFKDATFRDSAFADFPVGNAESRNRINRKTRREEGTCVHHHHLKEYQHSVPGSSTIHTSCKSPADAVLL